MDSLSIISRLGGGSFLEDLAEALEKTAAEVVETGKVGVVNAQFKISTRGQGNLIVTIDETVSRKSPKRDPQGALYVALDGHLWREDPRQVPLNFRDVNTDTGEVRETATAKEERVV